MPRSCALLVAELFNDALGAHATRPPQQQPSQPPRQAPTTCKSLVAGLLGSLSIFDSPPQPSQRPTTSVRPPSNLQPSPLKRSRPEHQALQSTPSPTTATTTATTTPAEKSFYELREEQVHLMSAGAAQPRSVKGNWPTASEKIIRLFADRHRVYKTYSTGYMRSQERFLFLLEVPPDERFLRFEQECYHRALAPTTAHCYWVAFATLDKMMAASCQTTPAVQRVSSILESRIALHPVAFPLCLTKELRDRFSDKFTASHFGIVALVEACWVLGQRFSDFIQLAISDFLIRTDTVIITVRRGKTIVHTKPYSLALDRHCRVTKNLLTVRQAAADQGWLFLTSHTNDIASRKALGLRTTSLLTEIDERLELRSIRRGGLQHMASLHHHPDKIRLFSKHSSEEMLMRYLAWGQVAESRNDEMLMVSRSMTRLLLNFSDRDAELFSVSAGSKDFRLFAKRPTIVATVDHADLPLHVQNPPVPKLSWELADEVVRVAAPPGEERLWHELSAFYRDSTAATKLWRERNAAKDAKPHHGSSLLDGDIDELLKSGFAVEVGDISSLPAHLHVNCIVFTVVEEHKHRRRVIAWPRATNFREREILDLLRSQHAIVPFSRISNLRKRVQKRFAAQLDLTKFFQQFTLLTSDNFLFAHDGKAYRLSTIPTGAVSPPILAQVLLRAVLALAIRQTATTEHVVFDTMIDNARLCSDDFAALQLAWDRTLEIFGKLGITVGDRSPPTADMAPYIFLGIRFDHVAKTTALSPKIVTKIQHALQCLESAKLGTPLSATDCASMMGISVWAAQVLDLPLAELYWIFKFQRRVSSEAFARGSWAFDRQVWPSILPHWMEWLSKALAKESVVPTFDDDLPTIIAYTDASPTGWGAVIFDGPHTSILAGRWSKNESALHINQLELLAIQKCFSKYVPIDSVPGTPRKVWLYVDNTSAISWVSKNKARGYFPNITLTNLARIKVDKALFIEHVSYVKSANNPADAPSRS